MSASFIDIFLLYILLPLIGIILAIVAVIVAKKNKLVADKKTIFFFLLTCFLLASPALLGFIDYWFMPYAYLCLSAFYLISGYCYLKLLHLLIKDIEGKAYYVELTGVLITFVVSAALFSLVFNLCNELQYGLWACTCMLTFIFPCIFRQTYRSFMQIPLEVYKTWTFRAESGEVRDEYMDTGSILVVELELFKRPKDTEPLNIKAKASENIPFGIWFKLFIEDYNKKNPKSSITYEEKGNPTKWIFYVVTSILGRKRYIDPELTMHNNRIKEKHVIIAKRVAYDNSFTNAPKNI